MSDRRSDSTLQVGLGADDRGISEIIAFILTFAIILGSVGLLYTTAFGAMMDYQENEQETNAVRAMDSLTDNFNDVIRSNGVNQRYGELSLREGRVATGDGGTEVNITISGENNDDPLGTGDDERFAGYGDESTVDLGSFAYESDDGAIAYEGGGLVRSDETGSVTLREPQIRCDVSRETAVISLVSISASDRSVGTSSGLGITMSVENRSSAVYTDVGEVTVSIDDPEDTEYETAWNDILGDDLEQTCSLGASGRVVVTIVEADIEY